MSSCVPTFVSIVTSSTFLTLPQTPVPFFFFGLWGGNVCRPAGACHCLSRTLFVSPGRWPALPWDLAPVMHYRIQRVGCGTSLFQGLGRLAVMGAVFVRCLWWTGICTTATVLCRCMLTNQEPSCRSPISEYGACASHSDMPMSQIELPFREQSLQKPLRKASLGRGPACVVERRGCLLQARGA